MTAVNVAVVTVIYLVFTNFLIGSPVFDKYYLPHQ